MNRLPKTKSGGGGAGTARTADWIMAAEPHAGLHHFARRQGAARFHCRSVESSVRDANRMIASPRRHLVPQDTLSPGLTVGQAIAGFRIEPRLLTAPISTLREKVFSRCGVDAGRAPIKPNSSTSRNRVTV